MPRKKYEAERYDPSLAHCSTLALTFDGSRLSMTGGKANYAYPAVSGKKGTGGSFSYTAERQRTHLLAARSQKAPTGSTRRSSGNWRGMTFGPMRMAGDSIE